MSIITRLRHPGIGGIAVYGLSTGLAALLTLVLTRVLWRSLTPSDFGVWSLIDPMLLPGASLLLLGIDHSIVKQVRANGLSLRLATGVLLTGTLPATLLGLLVMGVIAQVIFQLEWTAALVLAIAGEALILMLQTSFRATGLVRGFAAVLISRNVLYLALLVVLGRGNGPGPLPIATVFLSRAGCVLVVGLAALSALRPVFRLRWDLYRDALRYGFPLLLTTFVYALSDMADRWFLAEFTGVVAVGIYGLQLKLAAILSQAIVIPFGLWFPSERFRHLEDQDGGRRFFARTSAVLAVICAYLSGGVWLSRDLLLSLIAPGATASPAILACCLAGVVCLALSQALNVGLLMPGHTGKNAVCSAYAITATVIAAAGLVPFLGPLGAGLSRLAGGLVSMIVTAVLSNRVCPVPFPYRAMLGYFGGAVLVLFALDYGVSGHGLPGLVIALAGWSLATMGLGTMLWGKVRMSGPSRRMAA